MLRLPNSMAKIVSTIADQKAPSSMIEPARLCVITPELSAIRPLEIDLSCSAM